MRRGGGGAASAVGGRRAVGVVGAGEAIEEWRRTRSRQWSGDIGGARKEMGGVIGVATRKKTSAGVEVTLSPYRATDRSIG
jgi:hypothetical protein